MQTIRTGADIVVQGADGRIVALVEVKNPERFTADIAAATRRNLIVHGFIGDWSPFFLMVSQDRGFLWDLRSGEIAPDAPPTIEFPMRPVVERYLPSLANGDWLTGPQLELAVAQWLSDLTREEAVPQTEPERTLSRTEFLQLIHGGHVGTQVDY